jgi:hypothetical protein
MNRDCKPKRSILNPSKTEIGLLVHGSVASGNVGSSLKELARLDIEISLIKRHLRLKQALLNVAYNDLIKDATHEWSIDVDLRLEDNATGLYVRANDLVTD